ncbi:hypothetical protein EDB89DRAFT_1915676 [Lactarius sanguifluus]|nr:hypothetical protein EDB89DRAFT_1915676 [Lactarius sanguifluus]
MIAYIVFLAMVLARLSSLESDHRKPLKEWEYEPAGDANVTRAVKPFFGKYSDPEYGPMNVSSMNQQMTVQMACLEASGWHSLHREREVIITGLGDGIMSLVIGEYDKGPLWTIVTVQKPSVEHEPNELRAGTVYALGFQEALSYQIPPRIGLDTKRSSFSHAATENLRRDPLTPHDKGDMLILLSGNAIMTGFGDGIQGWEVEETMGILNNDQISVAHDAVLRIATSSVLRPKCLWLDKDHDQGGAARSSVSTRKRTRLKQKPPIVVEPWGEARGEKGQSVVRRIVTSAKPKQGR